LCSKLLLHQLLEVGVGPVGLDEGPGLLLYPAGQRELDLGVVGLGEEGAAALTRQHRLATDDLDGVGASPETSNPSLILREENFLVRTRVTVFYLINININIRVSLSTLSGSNGVFSGIFSVYYNIIKRGTVYRFACS